MNIFSSDLNPRKAAENLDDKRVNKMLLESCQILCTAVNFYGGKAPYKSTHINHPSNIWVRQTKKNWLWVFDHAARLASIYRTNTGKIHKCQDILNILANEGMIKYIPDGDLQLFPNCTVNKTKGISYKHIEDPIEAYKAYLSARWDSDTLKPKWANRAIPSFYRGVYA